MKAANGARVFVALALLASAFAAINTAQQPIFRSRVDLVHLDVSVLDKDRRPVRGLTKEDFVVLEDGVPQNVSLFDAVDVPGPVAPAAEWIRDVTPDTTTNETKLSRLWLVIVDDANIPGKPYEMKVSKQTVIDVIDRFGPEDLVTIVFTADSRPAQDFTNDRAKLLATLKNYNPGWAMSAIGAEQFEIGNLHTMRFVVEAMLAIPYKRKAMIWISPGPFLGPQGFTVLPQRSTRNGAPNTVAQARKVELSKEIFELARRANVPIYPISPEGLDGLPGDVLRVFASESGGHAYINTNEYGPGLDRIFDENSAYYLVGYYPTNTKTDGTYRRLDVRVNRQDVEVHTRSSYIAPKAGEKPPATAKDELIRASADPIPQPDLVLRATAAPFVVPGKPGLAAVAVALGVTQPVDYVAAASRVPVTTELRVSAFTTEGDLKDMTHETAVLTLRGGRRGDSGFDALARLDLPPGRFRLRVAAHHEEASRTGTVMVDVIVPDFAKEIASMSGVVISTAPGRPSAPRDVLRDVMPLIPTAQRDFEKFDLATALFDLYQNGSRPIEPAQVSIRVTDGRGTVVVNDAQSIGAERFAAAQISGKNRSPAAAEVRYRLPLDRLPSDRYLLTFEATIGTLTLRRDVQFSVR